MRNKIARLIYQSNHRGCKENDILLGKIVSNIYNFSQQELDLYDEFLSESDDDIYKMLCGTTKMPNKYSFLMLML